VNIFFLDVDPRLAAQAHVDKHVNKMIIETAQLLSTAHHLCPDTEPHPDLYKVTHQNHPSARWVRDSGANYWWTYQLLAWLSIEYTHRYRRVHASTIRLSNVLCLVPYSLWKTKDIQYMTPPPPAMPDDLKLYPNPRILDEAVANYRNYYKHGKADLHRWTRRNPPIWINGD
jgi:hypothetical protein